MGATTVDIVTLKKTETLVEYGMLASATIYNGSMVIRTSAGYATDGTDAANSVFLGIAMEGKTDATAVSATTKILVETSGIHRLTIAAATVADIGKTVFLSDNQTVTLTRTTYGIVVGRIVAIDSSTKVWVQIQGVDAAGAIGAAGNVAGLKVVVGQAAFTTAQVTKTVASTPITTVVAAAVQYNDTVAVATGTMPLMYNKTLTTSAGVYYLTVTRDNGTPSGAGFGYIIYGT